MTVEPSVSATDAFVAFGGAPFEMPAAASAVARDALRGGLRQMLAGAQRPESRFALDTVRSWQTRPLATAIGHGERLGPQWAAFVNGVAARGATVPAALAAAEYAHASGAVLFEAIALGLEIEARAARGAGAAHEARGWDPHGTYGRLGALFAAARALGVTGAALRHAVGIAATQAGGLRAAAGTMTEAFVPGKAAADAVEAVLLARAGFTGPREPLEGRRGFAALMAPGFDGAAAADGLGRTWLAANAGGSFATEPSGESAEGDRVPAFLSELESAADAGAVVARYF